MSLSAISMTLVQPSECQKQQKVVPYSEYDVVENGGQDPSGEYDSVCDVASMLVRFLMLAKVSVCQKP